MKKILLASTDDWQALIVDGKIIAEGHSLKPGDILEALGFTVEKQWIDNDDEGNAINDFLAKYQ